MDTTREQDIELIRRGTLSPDPNVRRQANVALERLKHEGSKVRSMREALIKAHKDGNQQEIKDINDWVMSHPEYQTYGRKKVWR